MHVLFLEGITIDFCAQKTKERACWNSMVMEVNLDTISMARKALLNHIKFYPPALSHRNYNFTQELMSCRRSFKA